MKKFVHMFVLPSLVFGLFFASCSKETGPACPEDFEEIGSVVEMKVSRTFTLPATRSVKIARADSVWFEADTTSDRTIQIDIEGLLDSEFDMIISHAINVKLIEHDIITDFEISQDELDAMLIAELGEDFTDLEALEEAKTEALETLGLSDCLRSCHKEFTDENGKKKKGRGACKFGCWAEAVISIIIPLIPIVI